MPGMLDEIIAAVFSGEGRLIAESDDAEGPVKGHLVVELRGFQVELRGHLEAGSWKETMDVSATPLESQG